TLVGEDPWGDEELPVRALQWTEAFASGRGAGLTLGAAEAGLAIVTPFVREAMIASAVARLAGASPLSLEPDPEPRGLRAELEQAHQGYPHLVRRGRKPDVGETDAAAGIAWWLVHRFLQRRPTLQDVGFLTDRAGQAVPGRPSGLVTEAFSAPRLAALARCLQGDPTRLVARQPGSPLANVVAVGTRSPSEQAVRERLLGYLLALAGRFSLDARALSDIVVEHLGIADSVSLPD